MFSTIDSLWTNARICTMDSSGDIIDGALAVKDGKIAWVGARTNLPEGVWSAAEKVIDVEGQWITPGLIDCHTHLVYGGNRIREFIWRLEGKTYKEIAAKGGGVLSTVEDTRSADEQTLFNLSAPRLRSLLNEGVTTVEIKSGYGLDLETELRMLRVARRLGESFPVDVVLTFLGAHTAPPEYKGKTDEYIDFICDTVFPAIIREIPGAAVDAFCETIAFDPAQVERLFKTAVEYGFRVKLHADQLSDSGGGGLAARFNALSADHLEYLSEQSAEKMAESGTVAVLLPGAFYYLKETRLPDIALMRKLGIPMAVSTDLNPGSSPVGSLLAAANMACVLFGLTPLEALKGITVHAARALGEGDRKGSLTPGKEADFVVWDITEPAELVYGLGFNPSTHIVKGGVLSSDR